MNLEKEIIADIKKKKTLRNLDDEFVKAILIKKNIKLPSKGKEYKKLIKEVRAYLHKVYGVFQIKGKELEGSTATKERLEIYSYLYKGIFAITGIPKSILDIACGLNPLSYKYLERAGFKGAYYATELTKKDCEFINDYFKENKIKGKAFQINLLKDFDYPKADVCFLFKVLDLVEHKLAEEIIKKVKSNYLVISFATRTIGRRKMNYPRRGWIEQLLKRLNLPYEIITEENEVFYVVKK